MILRPASRRALMNLLSLCLPLGLQKMLRKGIRKLPQEPVFIIFEHPDAFGGSPPDLTDTVLGLFFDKRRAEDFVCGMISYISSHEGRELFLVDGKAQDKDGTVWFQIVERALRHE